MKATFIYRFLLSLILTLTASLSFAQPPVSYVPENGDLQLEEFGPFGAPYNISAPELQQWSKLYPFVTSLLSDKLIRELSKVSPTIMQDYHYVPAQAVALSVRGANDKWVTYEATLAPLPAPPAVERQLKVFMVGLREGNQLLPNKIVLTIQGDRRE